MENVSLENVPPNVSALPTVVALARSNFFLKDQLKEDAIHIFFCNKAFFVHNMLNDSCTVNSRFCDEFDLMIFF